MWENILREKFSKNLYFRDFLSTVGGVVLGFFVDCGGGGCFENPIGFSCEAAETEKNFWKKEEKSELKTLKNLTKNL